MNQINWIRVFGFTVHRTSKKMSKDFFKWSPSNGFIEAESLITAEAAFNINGITTQIAIIIFFVITYFFLYINRERTPDEMTSQVDGVSDDIIFLGNELHTNRW